LKRVAVLSGLVFVLICYNAFCTEIFLPADGKTDGKWGITMYSGTNHFGPGTSNSDVQPYADAVNSGLRLSYKLARNLLLYSYYSNDAFPNEKAFQDDMNDAVQLIDPTASFRSTIKSAQTSGGGLKCTIIRSAALEISFDLGYEYGSKTVNYRMKIPSMLVQVNEDVDQGYSAGMCGLSFSKITGRLRPYLFMGIRSIDQHEIKSQFPGYIPPNIQDSTLLCLGCDIALFGNVSLLLEAQHENLYWTETKSKGTTIPAGGMTDSGGNIGLMFRF
jgi:hypothetical protein